MAQFWLRKFHGCKNNYTTYGKEDDMSVPTILLIILIILLIGALPAWPYSGGWGYYPSGGLGLVVVILLLLILFGRL